VRPPSQFIVHHSTKLFLIDCIIIRQCCRSYPRNHSPRSMRVRIHDISQSGVLQVIDDSCRLKLLQSTITGECAMLGRRCSFLHRANLRCRSSTPTSRPGNCFPHRRCKNMGTKAAPSPHPIKPHPTYSWVRATLLIHIVGRADSRAVSLR
jgi:hypothetical protein